MNKKQDRDLDVLSGMDEKIVDKQTAERYRRMTQMKKKSRKKWIVSATAMAASLALILSAVFILVPILGKQVPIYTGMTVSGNPDGSTTVSVQGTTDFLSNGVSGDYHGSHGEPNHDHPFDEEKEPIKDAVSDVLDIRSARDIYYTEPNTDIYITVHFDNPDDFLIQGFTLGGKTYANYMFEEGSDMENIIIKVNVGNSEGVIDYTIDGITYIDGEKIKNVKMQGDRTVCVGVSTDKQPTAAVFDEVIEYNAIRFTVATDDLLGLVAKSEGELYAVLYDGDTVVETKQIAAVGESEISFEGLVTGKLYQYAIVATYDALDGTGKNAYILTQKAVYTKSIVLFGNIEVGEADIHFSLLWDADFANKTLTSLTLYQGESVLRELDVTATAVEGLRADTAYALVATYRNGSATEQIRIDFITDKIYYTVNHYKEKLDGSYELDGSDSFEILQGATHTPDRNTYTGFVAPTAQSVTGTPNANTAINYYYDRIVSEVTYVDNNGNTDTVDLKYGAPFAAPAARENFVFDGWYSDEKLTAAVDAMPDHAITLYAKWIAETPVSLFSYQLTDTNDGYIITGISDKTLQTLCLPPYIGGLPVVGIGDSAFCYMPSLVEVILQGGVQSIGKSAFKGCSALSTVTVPASVTQIAGMAFMNCVITRVNISDLAAWCNIDFAAAQSNPLYRGASLYLNGAPVTDLQIPAGITAIKKNVFYGAAITSVSLPASVTEIGDRAFYNCIALTSVSLSAGLNGIGEYAFAKCNLLSDIALPAGLTALNRGALQGCTSLASISLPASITTLGNSVFEGCTGLASVTITEGLTTLSGNLFKGCTSLDKVTVPASVTAIPTGVFSGCSGLTELTLPFVGRSTSSNRATATTLFGYIFGNTAYEGGVAVTQYYDASNSATYYIPANLTKVTVTGGKLLYGAFSFCSSLEEITMPSGNYDIPESCFYGCSALSFLSGDAVVGAIGAYAFKNCSSIEAIDGMDVTAIGKEAFMNCTSLCKLHLKGNRLQSIGTKAFSGCSALETLIIPFVGSSATATEASAETLFGYLFGSTAYTGGTKVTQKWGDETVTYYIPTNLTKVTVTGGTLLYGAFSGCTMLTDITLSSQQEEIPAYAFSGCTALKNVSLPANLTVIGDYSFRLCFALESIDIPKSVNKIGICAFDSCKMLSSITIPAAVTTIGQLAFISCDALTDVYLNATVTSSTGAFSGATGILHIGKDVAQIPGFLFSCAEFTSAVFEDGSVCTAIGDYAFSSCSLLTSINIPESVASIGERAFSECTRLQSITVPLGVTTIGTEAFKACNSLTDIYFNATAISAPAASAFVGATGILHIGKNVTRIPAYLFDSARITAVIFEEDGVCTEIGSYAFNACAALTSVNAPQALVTIGDYAFSGCRRLVSINIPQGLATFGDYAFANCAKLASITIPEGVSGIGEMVFLDCSSLADIYFNVTAASNFTESFFASASGTLHIGKNVTRIPAYLFDGAKITAVVFEEGSVCTEIGNYAFNGCSLLESINIPQGIVSFGGYAFNGCTQLESVNIPDGATRIGRSAFAGMKSLTSIVLPASIESIGIEAFANCTHLYEVYNLIPDREITEGTTANGYVAFYARYVYTSRDAQRMIYEENKYFFDIGGVQNVLFAYLGTDTVLTLPETCNGESYVIGEAAFMESFVTGSLVTSVTIPSAVTEIGKQAFETCYQLKEVYIADGVKTIGACAFASCSIETLVLPTSVTYIGDSCFAYNYLLKSVQLPAALTHIGDYAFAGCCTLPSITIPATVTYIGEAAFASDLSDPMILSEVIFENPTGWSADGQILSAAELRDAELAAYYLTNEYAWSAWMRS